jgi:hypothetical protein
VFPLASPLWPLRAIPVFDGNVVLGRTAVIGGVEAREYFTSISIQRALALHPDDPFLSRRGWAASAGFLLNVWVDSANLIRRASWGVSADAPVLPWHQVDLTDFGLPLQIQLPELDEQQDPHR